MIYWTFVWGFKFALGFRLRECAIGFVNVIRRFMPPLWWIWVSCFILQYDLRHYFENLMNRIQSILYRVMLIIEATCIRCKVVQSSKCCPQFLFDLSSILVLHPGHFWSYITCSSDWFVLLIKAWWRLSPSWLLIHPIGAELQVFVEST